MTTNTYAKYCPNVFVAKCTEEYQKGDIIEVETRHGKINECIVYNLVAQRNGEFYYSIVRADGFNTNVRNQNKADRYANWAQSAATKSYTFFKASQEGRDFLSLAEPIKIGHHSERRHRALIERNHNRMGRSVAFDRLAESHMQKAESYEARTNIINLSMPESIEYFKAELEKAQARHAGLKDGTIPREHSYSLTYAKKEVKELLKKVELAEKLWG
ncbi:MAG: DUF3560 domain-containing protein [Pseudomonadota bacterium]|nr:DUF3560 domain-containing protein [Pseudomonadota bacterium]